MIFVHLYTGYLKQYKLTYRELDFATFPKRNFRGQRALDIVKFKYQSKIALYKNNITKSFTWVLEGILNKINM